MSHALRRIKRLLLLLQTAWSMAGITLIVVILTEAGFQAAFALKDWLGSEPRPDRRVLAEGYGGAAWPVQHYRELEALADRWEPYVYFRQKPFQGTTISIGADGLRATWQPPSPAPGNPPGRKPVEILMLGGSSLWGFGARDDQTIPSLLARRLFDRKWNVRVRNLSEIGYVSTQEVVALVRELQSGYRPDVVIFHDGVNDTTSALLERGAGLTTNEVNRRNEFNLLQSPSRLAARLLSNLIGNSGSYRFAQAVRRRFVRGGTEGGPVLGDEARARLAAEVVRCYQANLAIVERLGREFAFRPLFYWQPVVFTKPSLVPFEWEEARRFAWTEPMFREVSAAIHGSTSLGADPAFHDLSAIFADSRNLVFIDYCHTTEEANARIATAMADDLTALFRSTPPQDRKPSTDGGDPGGGTVR
jgi:hypothetical protein